MKIPDNKPVYFLYSDEHLKEQNSILNKVGKQFNPGTVVVNGKRKNFTIISETKTIARFIDIKIVAEGNIDDFVFTDVSITAKG